MLGDVSIYCRGGQQFYHLREDWMELEGKVFSIRVQHQDRAFFPHTVM